MKLLKRAFGSSRPKNILTINGEPVALGDDYNLEAHLARVLHIYSIDTIIDVGANEGQFGARLRKLGFDGEILSFEPVKETFEKLSSQAVGDSKWKTHNLAFGAERGQIKINVSESSDFSSILNANEFGTERFKGIKVSREEQIEVHRLDELIGTMMDVSKRRILLKTDTQGYDSHVIEGAKGMLDNVCAVLSEMSLIPIYEGTKHYLEMLDIYQSHGFAVSGLYPVSRNKKDLSLIEIDCVLINRKLFR